MKRIVFLSILFFCSLLIELSTAPFSFNTLQAQTPSFSLDTGALSQPSQEHKVRIRGYLYQCNNWKYITTQKHLFMCDMLSQDSSEFYLSMSQRMFSPFRSIPKPVPGHKEYFSLDSLKKLVQGNGQTSSEQWEQGKLITKQVILEKTVTITGNNSYSTDWVIAGKGASSRRLVWYLSPKQEPRR